MVLRRTIVMLCLIVMALDCLAQETAVTGRVELVGISNSAAKGASNVVVWLTPISTVKPTKAPSTVPPHPRLAQSEKQFEPRLLVVPVGTAVEFPNKDPFFHNVFSFFEGERFDLGLYEAGSTRTVRFDKPGISYIFCNIHPQMSAVVIALTTPYFTISTPHGEITIANVPPGRYTLNVWSEGSLPEELNRARREVNISDSDHQVGTIRLTAKGHLQISHKNKYGKDYDDPNPTTPGYAR
jgi:plastocyanin